ncbi:hypothetical protein [Streptococcus phage JX01]|nr:hypothetical protein [Streptococcus phage LYGO9]AFQ96005.1 hypothetical protein [Streptococcus phage JX01]
MDKNVKQDLLGLMYMLTEDADKQIIISTAAGTYVGNFIPKEKTKSITQFMQSVTNYIKFQILNKLHLILM